jgi:hypothetical protein
MVMSMLFLIMIRGPGLLPQSVATLLQPVPSVHPDKGRSTPRQPPALAALRVRAASNVCPRSNNHLM